MSRASPAAIFSAIGFDESAAMASTPGSFMRMPARRSTRYFWAKQWLHRLRRSLASGSPVLLASGLALAGLTLSNFSTLTTLNRTIVIVLLVVWAILLASQMYSEYRRRTFDPKLMLQFDEKFDSRAMREARSRAAKVLKDNQARRDWADYNSNDINDVLDFIEALGYFIQGDEITPEVAHNAFHYWVHGYYYAARKFLKSAREKDHTQWEFVEYLFRMTRQIELERIARSGHRSMFIHVSQIQKFLDEEIQLGTTGDNGGTDRTQAAFQR
jgi:hypothetical protein